MEKRYLITFTHEGCFSLQNDVTNLSPVEWLIYKRTYDKEKVVLVNAIEIPPEDYDLYIKRIVLVEA